MSGDALFVCGLLLATIAVFVNDKVRLDVVALLVVVILAVSGVLTPGEAVAGFGDTLVVLIAGLFVVGEALSRPAWPRPSAPGSRAPRAAARRVCRSA